MQGVGLGRMSWVLCALAVVPSLLAAQERGGAEAFLDTLEGEWTFELFREGADQPSLRGVRSYRRAPASHPSLFWTESFDGREVTIAGSLGFDPSDGRFYEFGAPSEGAPELWSGTLSEDGSSIEWRQALDGEGHPHGVLSRVNADRLEFRSDRLHVVFSRVRD